MKIVHLIPTEGWYGSETVASEIANRQAADHDVHFAWTSGPGFPPTLARRKLDSRVKLHVIPPMLGFHEAQARWLRRQLGSAPDILHSHLNPAAALARALDYRDARWLASLHIRFYWKHFASADAVLAISPWQLRDVPKRYCGQTFLVRNALTRLESAGETAVEAFRSRLEADDDTFVVGTIGRLHLDKGMDLLCEAFIRADLPRARLVILGEGPERERLSRYVNRCPDIVLMGYVDDAKQWMSAFDLYASTARSEPFGMTILDAMQLELPIVASRALGPQDILGTDSERLVDIGDVDGTARALVRAYERRERSVAYDLSPFQPEAAHGSLMEAYESAMSEPSRHAKRADSNENQALRNRIHVLGR